MENKEFIMGAILSIEDFNNVDPKLMSIINSNAEYRRIFEEYKEVSALTSECVPAPKKNGVSLHDAVMARVRNGDTAPRYINTSASGRKFMFSIATAASFAIVLVVAIIAVTATRTNGRNDHGSAWGYKAHDESVQYSQKMPSAFMPAPASGGATYNEKVASPYSGPEEARMESAEEEYCDTAYEGAATYDAKDDSENTTVLNGHSYASNVSSDSISIEITDDDIASRLAIAESRGISDEVRITEEDVEAYGRDNFVAWFDSIAEEENFTVLYGKKQFIRYCNDIWAKE